MRRILSAILILAPALVAAQTGVELTPTVGYRWGGEISAGSSDLFTVDMDVDQGSSFGLILDIPLNRFMQLELMADHQSTQLGSGGLFVRPDTVTDVDIDYYHVGLLWYWHAGRTRPFIISSLGITQIDPSLEGARPEDRFSVGIGGGVKIDINRHLALRFELRGVWTDTNDTDWWDDDWDDNWDDDWWDDCDHSHDCNSWNGFEDLLQAQAKVGLVITF